ncbi:MFS transporter [Saccharothrix violaceirubra]|uniref:MFS family permease n=1 Tax=Saccharothrix violaceirubra TaxID=413306 RepID=A0A7W7SY16_9PSEU|nr:MFS transporter [Saccharothrix violaceirubra]MBB4962999.1 MFS family permease [Saccharothrix violaceirubra]
MLRPYRELAAIPGLTALLCWALAGRLHLPTVPLAVAFLVVGWTDSYALAGVVGGAMTLGMGVASPLRGRAADRKPATPLLLATVSGYAVGITALGLVPVLLPASAWPVAVVVAFLVGVSTPPVTQLSRAGFQRLASGPTLNAVFTVEASTQELTYVIGPAAAAAVVAVASPEIALWGAGVTAVVGALGFLRALRRAGIDRPVPHERAHGGPALLRDRSLALSFLAAGAIVASLVSIDMVIVALARDGGVPALAGALAAVWGVGSVVGGLVTGGWTGPMRFARRMFAMSLGLLALVPVLPPVVGLSPWSVGVVLVIGGLTIAPTIAANNSRIGALAPEGRKAEAFGWMATFTTAGPALVLPWIGRLIDGPGPAAAAAAAGGLALLGTVAASAVHVPR